MDLIYELLVSYFREERDKNTITKALNFEQIVEKQCYKILSEIKNIIQDEKVEDNDCFDKIEKIVCLFESYGIDFGTRHDFWFI